MYLNEEEEIKFLKQCILKEIENSDLKENYENLLLELNEFAEKYENK